MRLRANWATTILAEVPERHFVKYTFLQGRSRLAPPPSDERARATSASSSPPARTSPTDHLLQAFSLVGTRGDADLMLVTETENLDRIHEFHVVLAQSGLMKWCSQPYSFLGLRKGSEYSDESRTVPRAFRGKYLFVYPFVKTREWYALPADERWRIMQEHIKIGREYPQVDNHTTYSFGLDDQEFVVAFDTDDAGGLPRPRPAPADDRGLAPSPCATRRASRASPPRSSARSTRSTASRFPPSNRCAR